MTRKQYEYPLQQAAKQPELAGKQEGVKKVAMRYVKIFFKYTFGAIRSYIRGLFPKTFISEFTNPQCRKVLYVEKTWMGQQLSYRQYPLEEINTERLKAEKENIPRIQKIISDYEGEYGLIIADKIEKNHT